MGVTNFCKLMIPLCPPSTKPEPFDSLIVDCQSYLYSAIDLSLETEENAFFHEICEHVWQEVKKLIHTIGQFTSTPFEIVLSFDGEGPPMKYPKQRERRSKTDSNRKTFYRYVLFGQNSLSLSVAFYIKERLDEAPLLLTVILSECDVPGEGEHKIFHVAEERGYRNPIVASIDQDVFLLSFLRLNRYESLQVYRYQKFYNVNRLARSLRMKRFVDVSFLFGNDFIKPLVNISLENVAAIQEAIEWEGSDETPPVHLSRFLQRIRKRLRFLKVESVDRNLMVSFWMTYLWVLDYYTQRCFPQQFMENPLYDAFDRSQLLTGLLEDSQDAFEEARERYSKIDSQPITNAEERVYQDAQLLKRLRAYWQDPKNGVCRVIRT